MDVETGRPARDLPECKELKKCKEPQGKTNKKKWKEKKKKVKNEKMKNDCLVSESSAQHTFLDNCERAVQHVDVSQYCR